MLTCYFCSTSPNPAVNQSANMSRGYPHSYCTGLWTYVYDFMPWDYSVCQKENEHQETEMKNVEKRAVNEEWGDWEKRGGGRWQEGSMQMPRPWLAYSWTVNRQREAGRVVEPGKSLAPRDVLFHCQPQKCGYEIAGPHVVVPHTNNTQKMGMKVYRCYDDKNK